jgi:hypothetical protein
MEYTKGKMIQFNIYNTIVEGEIVSDTDEHVVIKTTKDQIRNGIGHEQTINKSHIHRELDNTIVKQTSEEQL